MATSYDAIIVGGGVIGSSIAFHLTRLGMRKIILLERDYLTSQATGQSGGLVRTHYTNAPEARLALAGLAWFREWRDRVGGASGFTRTGFLQIVAAHDAEALRANVEMLRTQVGVETHLISAEETHRLQPGLELAEGELAAYEPHSGYADPHATTRSLAEAASQAGAIIREKALVTNLIVEHGRICGVELKQEVISAPVVILANGGWSVPLAAAHGLELPIRPVLSQIAILRRPDFFPEGRDGHITLIDRARGYYARPEGFDTTLVGLSGMSRDLEEFDEGIRTFDLEVPGLARNSIAGRFPAFKGAKFIRKQGGPLDVTPDKGAILGATPIEGLFLAVGMSGSGFKKAPAIGACIAELILHGQANTAPIEPFRLSRFAEGDLICGRDYAPLPNRIGVTPH
ncbi:MAG: FAD-binding oxidoreductase [Roseiflexaceae bacterium]